jgi:hypothetical protein
MVHIEELIKHEFPHFELPHLSKINLHWINKTKIIENRKILIEDFLQTLLSSDHLRSDPYKWLRKLDLPEDFYFLGEGDDLPKRQSFDHNIERDGRMSLNLQFFPSSFK